MRRSWLHRGWRRAPCTVRRGWLPERGRPVRVVRRVPRRVEATIEAEACVSAEAQAHDDLRDAIRRASLALWDRNDDDVAAETRPTVATGVLVDYVVVATFDMGEDHTVLITVLVVLATVALVVLLVRR